MKEKEINKKSYVNAVIAGDTIKFTTAFGSKEPVVQKFSKDYMINTRTNELIKIKHAKTRTDPKNFRSLRKTFEKIRLLINANFNGGQNQLFVTLTYKDSPMKDTDKLYKDFKAFIKRLRKKVNAELAYLLVIEPTAKGGWHCHTLIKRLDKKNLYLPNRVISELWGQGFVNVRRIKTSDNIACYLSAYLGDIDLNNLNDNPTSTVPKNIIKGGRLTFYPNGMRIYRTSRKGIKQPRKIQGFKEELQKSNGILGISPDYYRTFEVVNSFGEPINIEVEYYSKKKAKLQKAKLKEK